MNILEVSKRLRQRPPFQMVERVLELREGEYIKGIKNVSVNEPYFMGHFPGLPVMPGVLIQEACAQLCSLAISDPSDSDDAVYVLLKVKDFKFIKPVVPGDTLILEAKKLVAGAGFYSFEVSASVGDKVHAKGEMAFAKTDINTIYGK